jgi:hypothetical protein
MNFKEAESTVIPFGKYKGKTLGQAFNESPLYFDWLIDKTWLLDPFKSAVETFLKDDSVQDDLSEALNVHDGEDDWMSWNS